MTPALGLELLDASAAAVCVDAAGTVVARALVPVAAGAAPADAALEAVDAVARTAGSGPLGVAANLADARQVQDTQAFGRGAQVLMDDDAVFLALFDDRWLITAAGCTPRGDLPYDCTLKGG